MNSHPSIEKVKQRMLKDEIGGAADTAKEIIAAIHEFVQSSKAPNAEIMLDEVEGVVIEILRIMQTLAPPLNALHRVMGQGERLLAQGASSEQMRTGLMAACQDFQSWADSAMSKVEQYGVELIPDVGVVMTLSMSSTVWRILRRAKALGKQIKVIGTEARPSNEGLWTATEMHKSNIPVEMSIDAAVGELAPLADLIIVGADAISSTGHALCKSGTFPAALAAKYFGKPFYIAADTLKFDPCSLLGLPFRRDEIHRKELLDETYPPEVKVVGHYFDVTPPECITGIITEQGVIPPYTGIMMMMQMNLSQRLNALLPAWNRLEL